MNTCQSCRHAGLILNADKITTLVCKRFPPVPQAALVMKGGQPDWISCTVWPGVEREDSCGEYAQHTSMPDTAVTVDSTWKVCKP